jgi:hypothetical protein
MAATYVHHITIKTNDVNEPKFKTIVIESPDTNAEMYEKMKALTAFERAVSTGFHLSIESSVKVYNHETPEEIYKEYIEAWCRGFNDT